MAGEPDQIIIIITIIAIYKRVRERALWHRARQAGDTTIIKVDRWQDTAAARDDHHLAL